MTSQNDILVMCSTIHEVVRENVQLLRLYGRLTSSLEAILGQKISRSKRIMYGWRVTQVCFPFLSDTVYTSANVLARFRFGDSMLVSACQRTPNPDKRRKVAMGSPHSKWHCTLFITLPFENLVPDKRFVFFFRSSILAIVWDSSREGFIRLRVIVLSNLQGIKLGLRDWQHSTLPCLPTPLV